jgi:hypothetical protein
MQQQLTEASLSALISLLEQRGQQEAQQVVQLAKIVLQRRARKHHTPTAACSQLTQAPAALAGSVLESVGLIQQHLAPLPLAQEGAVSTAGA